MTPRRLLGFLIVNFLIAGVALQYVSVSLYKQHRIPAYCDGTVIHPLHDLITRYQETDSWRPMLQAEDARFSPRGIYQTVFFDQRTKFQYPLASLIPIAVLRAAGLNDYWLLDTLKWLSIAVLLAQIPCVFAILQRSSGKSQSWQLTLAIAVMLVFSFYPLLKAYTAGQVQILLDLLFSVAFLTWIDKKDRLSGFFMGLAVLVKPQYGLFLLWALVRKNWKFLLAAGGPVASGVVLSLLMYGWKNNIQYLDVVRYMSRHGEAYFPNQSVNGLLNRLLQNGSSTTFDVHGFAPYLPLVYFLTLLTSVALVALVIVSKTPPTPSGRIAEFGVIAIASTAASPIAWEHHYGILLPLFAWILPQTAQLAKVRGASTMLLIAFVLCADDWRITNLLASASPWNVFQSTLLVGAAIFFIFLRIFSRKAPASLIQSEPALSSIT